MPVPHCAQPRRDVRRQFDLDGGAVPSTYRWARPVGRQVEGGNVCELAAPVGELLVQRRTSQELALPDRVVRVLHRQGREVHLLPTDRGTVPDAQLVEQHTGGPAVGDDVRQRQRQDMLVAGEAEQPDPQQWSALQVVRAHALLGQALVQFGLAPGERQRRQVGERDVHVGRWMHTLVGLPVGGVERRAQRLVPGNEPGQCRPQGVDVELAAQPHRGGSYVLVGVRVELVQEPQPLLGRRQRQRAVPRCGGDRRGRAGGGQRGGESGDGRRAEQRPR